MQIRLPSGLSQANRVIARRFIMGETFSEADRPLLFETFDLLHNAIIVTALGKEQFSDVYERLVERPFADDYLRRLLESSEPETLAEPLRAQVSRKILPTLKTNGLVDADKPHAFYLLAYCLYWWYAFAKGYAFEIIILKDMEAAGIQYQAHHLLNIQTRRSPFDVAVLGFRGDIKSSIYFLHAVRTRGIQHHFYITRVYDHSKHRYIRVVFLKPEAWQAIDGETTPIPLKDLAVALPGVFQIPQGDTMLVIVTYEDWKARVLRVQAIQKGDKT
jgi:hypothetical protein